MSDKKVYNSYNQEKTTKIPSWLKIIVLKYWVACAAFYFFAMGGSFIWYNPDKDGDLDTTLKLVLFVGMGYSLFKEYIEKNFIRFMRTNEDDTYRYNLINLHGTKSFLLHFLYCMVSVFVGAILTTRIIPAKNVFDDRGSGYGPFTFGAVLLVLDIICIAIKNGIIALVKHIQYKKAIEKQNRILAEDEVPVIGEEFDNDNNNNNDLDNFVDKE